MVGSRAVSTHMKPYYAENRRAPVRQLTVRRHLHHRLLRKNNANKKGSPKAASLCRKRGCLIQL